MRSCGGRERGRPSSRRRCCCENVPRPTPRSVFPCFLPSFLPSSPQAPRPPPTDPPTDRGRKEGRRPPRLSVSGEWGGEGLPLTHAPSSWPRPHSHEKEAKEEKRAPKSPVASRGEREREKFFHRPPHFFLSLSLSLSLTFLPSIQWLLSFFSSFLQQVPSCLPSSSRTNNIVRVLRLLAHLSLSLSLSVEKKFLLNLAEEEAGFLREEAKKDRRGRRRRGESKRREEKLYGRARAREGKKRQGQPESQPAIRGLSILTFQTLTLLQLSNRGEREIERDGDFLPSASSGSSPASDAKEKP